MLKLAKSKIKVNILYPLLNKNIERTDILRLLFFLSVV